MKRVVFTNNATANDNGAMEADTISKNGENHRGKLKFFVKLCCFVILTMCIILTGCKKDDFPPSSTPMIQDQWTDGSIGTFVKEVWYSFEASYKEYRVWCNDSIYGDGTKTASVQVSAYRSDGTVLFNSTGWDTPSVIRGHSGMVYLKVIPINSGGSGTFAIVYSEKPERPERPSYYKHSPLTENQWADGSIGTQVDEVWYSFEAETKNTYYVWSNDSIHGDNTKTANVQVTAYNSYGTVLFSSTAGWNSPSIISGYTGTVNLKVITINSDRSGSFAIAYSILPKRPGRATMLTANQWTDGSITSLVGDEWYFFASSGSTYVWCNDGVDGNGTKTVDVQVTAYRSDGTVIFSSAVWSSSSQIYYTGTVYLRVTPMNIGDTGTFGIVYSTGNTRPLVN